MAARRGWRTSRKACSAEAQGLLDVCDGTIAHINPVQNALQGTSVCAMVPSRTDNPTGIIPMKKNSQNNIYFHRFMVAEPEPLVSTDFGRRGFQSVRHIVIIRHALRGPIAERQVEIPQSLFRRV